MCHGQAAEYLKTCHTVGCSALHLFPVDQKQSQMLWDGSENGPNLIFTFMYLADAFIQSNLHFVSYQVFRASLPYSN